MIAVRGKRKSRPEKRMWRRSKWPVELRGLWSTESLIPIFCHYQKSVANRMLIKRNMASPIIIRICTFSLSQDWRCIRSHLKYTLKNARLESVPNPKQNAFKKRDFQSLKTNLTCAIKPYIIWPCLLLWSLNWTHLVCCYLSSFSWYVSLSSMCHLYPPFISY